MPRVYTGTSAGRGRGVLDYVKTGTGMVKDVVGLIQNQQLINNERARIENEERNNRYKRQLTVIQQEVAARGWEGALNSNPTIFKEFLDTTGFVDPNGVYEDLRNNPVSMQGLIQLGHSQYLKTGLATEAGRSMAENYQKVKAQPGEFAGKGKGLELAGGQVTETTTKEPRQAEPGQTKSEREFTPLEAAIDYYYGTVSEEPPTGEMEQFKGAVVENRFPVAGDPKNKQFHETLGRASPDERKQAYESWKQKRLTPAETAKETPPKAREPETIEVKVRDVSFGQITPDGKWKLSAGTDRPATKSFDAVARNVMEFTEYEGSLEEWKKDFIKVNNLKGETTQSLGKDAWRRWMGGYQTDKEFILPGPPKESETAEAIRRAPKEKASAIQKTYQQIAKEVGNIPQGEEIPEETFVKATRDATKLNNMAYSEMRSYMEENPGYVGEVLTRAYGDNWKERLQRYPEEYLKAKEVEVSLEKLGANMKLIEKQMEMMGLKTKVEYLQALANLHVAKAKLNVGGDGPQNQLLGQSLSIIQEKMKQTDIENEVQLARALDGDPVFATAYKYYLSQVAPAMGLKLTEKNVGKTFWFPRVFGQMTTIPKLEPMTAEESARAQETALQQWAQESPENAQTMAQINQFIRSLEQQMR